MPTPHVIRLRGPWDHEPPAVGGVRSTHKFNCPTNLDPGERVWLVCEGYQHPFKVALNDQSLGHVAAFRPRPASTSRPISARTTCWRSSWSCRPTPSRPPAPTTYWAKCGLRSAIRGRSWARRNLTHGKGPSRNVFSLARNAGEGRLPLGKQGEGRRCAIKMNALAMPTLTRFAVQTTALPLCGRGSNADWRRATRLVKIAAEVPGSALRPCPAHLRFACPVVPSGCSHFVSHW